jgi:D-amino peptidase
MAGTADGVLNHTVSGVDWQNLWFNGTLVGETGINAALCGTWDCPVLLVTGDRAAGREAKALLGDGLTTVEVKEGLGSKTARMLTPKRARELVEEGAKRALSDLKAVAPYDPGKPCEIKVEYKSTTPPQKLRFQPGVELVDERTIVSRADDWWTAWKQFFFAAG